jgi:hypothetical protein
MRPYPLRKFTVDLRHHESLLYADVMINGGKARVDLFKADERGRRVASIVRMTPAIRAEMLSRLSTLGVAEQSVTFNTDCRTAGPSPEAPGGPKNPPPPFSHGRKAGGP